jgi:hypothetical protein
VASGQAFLHRIAGDGPIPGQSLEGASFHLTKISVTTSLLEIQSVPAKTGKGILTQDALASPAFAGLKSP